MSKPSFSRYAVTNDDDDDDVVVVVDDDDDDVVVVGKMGLLWYNCPVSMLNDENNVSRCWRNLLWS